MFKIKKIIFYVRFVSINFLILINLSIDLIKINLYSQHLEFNKSNFNLKSIIYSYIDLNT